jgi:transposase-like protein
MLLCYNYDINGNRRSKNCIKNGFLDERQRYKCKDPRFIFLKIDQRQKYTLKDKMKVIKLYLENNGIRSISRLTGIAPSMVLKWIKKISETIKNQIEEKLKTSEDSLKDIVILEIDELCTYVKKNLKMEENSYLFG